MLFRKFLLIGVLSVLCTSTSGKKRNTKLTEKVVKNDTTNNAKLKKSNVIESFINDISTMQDFKMKKPDYCNPELCLPDTKHIGCNNTQNFITATCLTNTTLAPMTLQRKNHLVHIHNKFRSKIASGMQQGYAPAENMPELWDNELAYLAELNVRTCTYHHDECHNTEKFPFSGQNIAMYMDTIGYGDTDKVAAYSIKMMFMEHKYANMNHIVSYSDPESGQDIGHFTLMVNEKVTHVGCAISKFLSNDAADKEFKTTYIVCNYNYANIDGTKTYACGAPCRKCMMGCSKRYEGLCNPAF